ncbi:MAG: hypothetical protein M1357_00840 [Candidatus Marsarchaeota archaeon]|nr:hypothetical protein [Candidatus Marsarchaeota archaeon]
MDLRTLVQLVDTATIILMLGVGGWQDFVRREVDDWVWLMAVPAVMLNVVALYFGSFPIDPATWLIGEGIMAMIGFILVYFQLFGGADALALVACAAAMPAPTFLLHSQIPFYGFTVFDNGVVLAALYAAAMVVYNVVLLIVRGGAYLEPYKGAKLSDKLILLLAGHRVKVSNYLDKAYKTFPLEEFSIEGSSLTRKPLFTGIDQAESREEEIRRLVDEGRIAKDEMIWTSPGLPIVTLMLLGVLASHFFGDLVFTLETFILKII